MPTPPAVIHRYYPTLSSIISLDDFPAALDFVKQALQSLFSKIHYKDLQYKKSPKGDAAFYSLKIVSKKLAIELFGSGISLVINPDEGSTADPYISAFPVTLEYQWKILAYLRSFNLQNFSFSPQEFFELALQICNVSEEQAIASFINTFTEPANNTITPLRQFINDLNAFNQGAVINETNFPINQDTTLNQVVRGINQQTGKYATLLAFGTYLLKNDIGETKKKLGEFLRKFIPDDFEAYIKDMLVPKARVTLALSAAIEFPRNILQPVYNASGVGPGGATGTPFKVVPADANGFPKVQLKFGQIELYADTEQGLGYNAELVLGTNVPAMIGTTGLIVDIQSLKVDLSETKNIAEADADGRPATFKGVYIGQATVAFPSHWSAGSSNVAVTAKNVLIGNEGGVSGEFMAAGQKAEAYVPFSITAGNIAVNIAQKTVVVTASGSTETIPYEPGKELYIRDKANHYFKISTSGNVTTQPAASTTPLLQFNFANGMHIDLYSFYVKMHQNEAVAGSIVGQLSGGILQTPVRITIEFNNGLIIKADVPNGLSIINNSSVEIKLDGLEFGKSNDHWLFGIAGKINIKKDIPVVSKFLPKYFNLYEFLYSQDTGFHFDLEAGWANGTIVRGDDTGGISGYIPINLTAENNGLLLKGINFKAKANPNAEIEALLVGAGLKIGPVAGAVEDFGAKLTVNQTTEANGTFGDKKTQISLVGPSGIFVEIKTKVIEGSGYLHISDEEYVGALSLTLNTKKFKLGITAVGIITVKMPDGGKGTAVLALLCVTFSPGIPLIWGFQLQGVGGLVGIHHTINTDALRAGAKEGTLDSILFPVIDVKNYSKIVDNMKTVFPIQRNQFVIGIMAKIVWPSVSPKLFIDFGLMVELSDPVRLAILGKLALRLGDDDNSSGASKLIRLNVAFIGIIDFDEKYMSFDASIYDSRIAFITLSGDMAMRLFWGDHKEFVLSVGGFHPAYDVPAYLKLPPNMKRITIGLINGKVGPVEMRLILETYFAVSTNTLQFGAKLDLYIKFWKLEIIGKFGFDVLFQFKPFRFVSKVYAMLAVLFKGSEILSISMEVNLVGPGPWHADGSATFKVLFFKKTCKFEKTWGDQPQIPAQPPLAIQPMIVQDIQKPENWIAQLPDSSKSHVQIKPAAQGVLVMDPLGDLSITQRTAPLGVQLSKFGETTLSDAGKYDISEVVINSGTPANSVTYNASQNTTLFGESREDFAPTQFKSMNDDEKLKAKSFEYLKSGVKISGGNLYTAGYFERQVKYDMVIIDDEYVATHKAVPFPRFFVNSFVKGGLISSNAISVSKNLDVVTPLVSVSQGQHVLVASDTLAPVQAGSNTLAAKTLAEALDIQSNLSLNNLTELVYA